MASRQFLRSAGRGKKWGSMSAKLIWTSLEIESFSNDDCPPKSGLLKAARLHFLVFLGWKILTVDPGNFMYMQFWALFLCIFCIYLKEVTKAVTITDLSIMGNDTFQHTWIFLVSEAFFNGFNCQNFYFHPFFIERFPKFVVLYYFRQNTTFFWWLMLKLTIISDCIEPECGW